MRKSKLSIVNKGQFHRITRSREVKQSYFTTIFTTLISLFESSYLVSTLRPDLIVCNGPGTCVPICFVSFLLNIFAISNTKIIFIESFCRVKKLSVTGYLLYFIAHRFLVQWPQLAEKYHRAEYLGDFE
jgi:beta-1,4-N-acetylglucosaminyltransferase